MQIGGWVNQTIAIILLVIAFLWSIITLIYWFKNRHKTVDPSKEQLQLDLVRLLHEGKDILAELKKTQNIDPRTNTEPQVTSEIYFESWFADVTAALKNTGFEKLWYEDKVVNYRNNFIVDYIGASGRALDRIESIMKLISDKEGSQS